MVSASLSTELAKASARAIRDIMPVLEKYWRRGDWMSQRNPFLKDSVGHIKTQVNTILKNNDASQYVAASAIVHCYDGWSYLGRALEAEMAGDPDAARHLGYYAELRAAMSILASEGIGVFQNQHIVVTGINQSRILRGKILNRRGGTHQFAWDALEWWANSSKGTRAILSAIKPGGVSLWDWLAQFSVGAAFVTHRWLQQWGLDLARFADDREARNIASYRPTGFTTPGPRSIESIIESILQIWEVCDPGANGGFPVLDCHLLRSSLDLVWKNQNPSWRKNYGQLLSAALNGVSLTSQPLGPWHEFLSHQFLADQHPVIDSANGQDDALHPDHSNQVLARATLLLRIATGCSAELLLEAGPDGAENLEFWTSGASVRRRLWPESSPAISPVDLWPDIEDAQESIGEWIGSGTSLCHHALWTERAMEASLLTTAERAFLWGVSS